MSKHTEGKWKSFFKNKYKEWNVSLPVLGGMNVALCANGVPGVSLKQKEANAHLISAAPDMLEVLESVEWNYYSHHIKTCPCCDWAKDRNHSPDCKLAAALRKARGEA